MCKVRLSFRSNHPIAINVLKSLECESRSDVSQVPHLFLMQVSAKLFFMYCGQKKKEYILE